MTAANFKSKDELQTIIARIASSDSPVGMDAVYVHALILEKLTSIEARLTALEAEAKVGLKMNIEEKNLARLLKALPALRNPTISTLSQSGWIAVETIIDEHVVREIIPQLKAAGAEGIIEYPLNKVVY